MTNLVRRIYLNICLDNLVSNLSCTYYDRGNLFHNWGRFYNCSFATVGTADVASTTGSAVTSAGTDSTTESGVTVSVVAGSATGVSAVAVTSSALVAAESTLLKLSLHPQRSQEPHPARHWLHRNGTYE